MGQRGSAWDRQRAALRAEIVDAAVELFVTKGFAATSVDEIAAAVGVSRRSFFRYFGTKEDVLLGDLVSQGEAIARELERRPDDEDPWSALLRAMVAADARRGSDSERDLAIGRMMVRTPSLRARQLEKRLRWQEMLDPLVARRLAGPDSDRAASAIVATILTCLDVATEHFVETEGMTALEDLFAEALTTATSSCPPGLIGSVLASTR